MYGSYSPTNPPLTNNPFIENASHPSTRYPDLSTPPIQPQLTTWTDPTLSTGPQSQYQPNIYQQYPQIQPQQIPPGYTQQLPLQPPPFQPSQPPQNYPYQQPQPLQTTPFNPSSSLGQPSITGSNYGGGYLQSQPPPYNPAQQQLLNNPNYISQFDPYAPTSQGWGDTTTTPQSQSLSTPTNIINSNTGYGNNSNQFNSGPVGFSRSGDPHPRDYIRSHKQEIEAWDQYTWKQLLNSCEALKRTWESRRNELKDKLGGLQAQLRYAGYYDRTQIQQEGGRIQGVSLKLDNLFR
jgi:hypothetical protein